MGTSWMEIITNSAMVFIDDVRLQDDAAISPAQFFRRMTLYMNMAIPVFNRPPEMMAYLTRGMQEPTYDDYEWVSTQESTAQSTVVATGLTGFELFSCVIREMDAAGNVTLTPYGNAEYDPQTGNVTFPQQSAAGTTYVLDFYTDGSFLNELTPSQKRILGLCVACVWDERFSRNWLNMQMKIHDQSFETVNESNYIKEVTARLSTNQALLAEALHKYEQDCAYLNTVTARNAGHQPMQFV